MTPSLHTKIRPADGNAGSEEGPFEPTLIKATGHYLGASLARLAPWLGSGDVSSDETSDPVVEVMVNRPGEVWVERQSGATRRSDALDLDERFLALFARQVAAFNDRTVSETHPLLSGTLPGGERIQIVRPPAAPGGHAFAIRRATLRRLTLRDYARTGAFEDTRAATRVSVSEEVERLRALHAGGDTEAFLRAAVKARQNIVISGGTSTGKTTFLNALLAEVGEAERIVTLEDTRELELLQPNALHLVAARAADGVARVGLGELLEAALRLRPDRLIMGELRGAEAYVFLRAANTGHPGSLTTVHANSPRGAVEQIALMAMQAGLGLGAADIRTYVRTQVDVIIQLERCDYLRRVSEVWFRHAASAEAESTA